MKRSDAPFFCRCCHYLLAGLGLALLLPATHNARATEVTFQISQHTNQPGDRVTARICVAGFRQVTSVQFTWQWNPEVLGFVGTGDYELNGLSDGNFGTALTNTGRLTFSWDDPDAIGITLADGSAIFSAHFDVLGSKGSSSPLALVDVPTPREVAINFEAVSFRALDGQVLVEEAGTNGPPVTLVVGSAHGLPGTEVWVPVQVNGFAHISTLQCSLHWTSSVAAYLGVEQFGLPGLAEGNFGASHSTNGVLTVSWDDPEGACKSVADRTTIFGIKLRLVGMPESTTSVWIDGTPTLAEAADCGLQPVPLLSIPGQVGIEPPVTLEIAYSGNYVMIAWPTSAVGFLLESTDSLSPAPQWSDVLSVPFVLGNQYRFTNELGAGPRFYRLRK